MVEKIVTGPFRLAFPTLFEPRAFTDGGKPKYSVTMLFPKNGEPLLPKIGGPGIKELRKLAMAAVKEKWGEDKAKWPSNLKTINFKTHYDPTGKNGFPVRDGDTVTWDGFPGHFFLKATKAAKDSKGNRQKPPVLMDKTRTPILDPMDVEGGLICRAKLYIKGYETPKAKGIGVYLNGLQVLKDDGTRFSGSGADFEEWEDEESGSGFNDAAF